MQDILISIIVPVYNGETYLDRCFSSITRQSYKNIECLFVDDGSKDTSYKKLSEFTMNYSGNITFRIIRHEENKGLSAARNTGILNATGEYLYFLDADDEITENCIQSLIPMVNKYGNVDIVQGNAYEVPRHKNNPYDISAFPEYTEDHEWIGKHFYINPVIPVTAWNKLIRKKFIEEKYLYFLPGILHEDVYWSYLAAKKIRSMAFTKEYGYIHYIVPNSIMTDPDRTRSIQSFLIITGRMRQDIYFWLLNEDILHIYNTLKFCKNMIKIDIKYKELLPECERQIEYMDRIIGTIRKLPLIIFKRKIKDKVKIILGEKIVEIIRTLRSKKNGV